jgi:rhamnose utilization protein RhaD (predicted bifunctional aldolase and dehydrogenase)
MNQSLTELIKISRRVGRDPNLACGASGNTSVKTSDDKFMFVKASGTALADMNAKRGWCKMNLQAVRRIIKSFDSAQDRDKKRAKLSSKKREVAVAERLLAACVHRMPYGKDNIKGNCRPSIETNLHAFLDKCVIHLHPTAVGAFVNSKNGKAELEKLFSKEKFPPLWVSYANPGFALAKKIANLSSRYQKKYGCLPQILFLEKHGLFVSATTAKKALQLVWKVIKRCGRKLIYPAIKKIKRPNGKVVRAAKLIIKDAFFKAAGQYQPVHFFYNKIISAFANYPETPRLLKAGPLNPNEIIYCSGSAVWLEKAPQAGKLQKEKIMPCLYRKVSPNGKKQKPPIAFLVKNLGLFVVGSRKSASIIEQVVCNSLFVRYNAQRFGGIVALTKSEQDFIQNCGA